MKKKALILFMTGMLATTSLTGCGSWNGDDVALTVGKEEISADVANFYARYTQATYETYYSAYLGEDMWNSEAEKGKTYEESVKDSVAGELEAMALCDAHKKDYDVALTDEEKASIKKAAKSFSEDNGLEQKEKVSGQEKAVEKVLTMMMVSSKVRTAIESEADTEVSDEEAAQKKMQYVLFSNTKTTEEGETQELTEEQVKNCVMSFVGEYDQIPPMYSALKVNGKKLYELAREGKTIERKSRKVEIKEIRILEMALPRVRMEVSCSKGTYIRTLCHDIGEKLGCFGCMESLLRTKVSRFELESSLKLSEIQKKIYAVDDIDGRTYHIAFY